MAVTATEQLLAENEADPGSLDAVFYCGIHMKRSMHETLMERIGVDDDHTVYLDDTGHMSGVDPLLALDRADPAGKLEERGPGPPPGRRHRLHLGSGVHQVGASPFGGGWSSFGTPL